MALRTGVNGRYGAATIRVKTIVSLGFVDCGVIIVGRVADVYVGSVRWSLRSNDLSRIAQVTW